MSQYRGTTQIVELGLSPTASNSTREVLVKRGFEQPQWYFDKRSFNIKIRMETVKEFVSDFTFQNILDIGCGNGSVSIPILNSHNHLTLLDMSATMLSIARSGLSNELRSRVRFINEDFMRTRLEPHSYDLVVCLGVLAYVDDTKGFVDKLVSLLKTGGSAIVECTDSGHPFNYLGRLLGHARNVVRPPKFPIIPHSSSEVTRIFKGLGFRVDGSFRYSLPPPGIRTFLSQDFLYKAVRTVYGRGTHNRFPGFGDECIYHFRQEV